LVIILLEYYQGLSVWRHNSPFTISVPVMPRPSQTRTYEKLQWRKKKWVLLCN